MHTKLEKFRAKKLPLMQSYLHAISPDIYIPQYKLCLTSKQDYLAGQIRQFAKLAEI